MSGNPVIIRGPTTLRRAGNLFSVFAVIWMLAGMTLAEWFVALFVARESRPLWLSQGIVASPCCPLDHPETRWLPAPENSVAGRRA